MSRSPQKIICIFIFYILNIYFFATIDYKEMLLLHF